MTAPTSATAHALSALASLPDVAEAVERARGACTTLRWHQALRRRIPEAATESRVRGAAASALLEGAEPAGSAGSVDVVRGLMTGAIPAAERPDDPVWRVLEGVVRCTSATESVSAQQLRSPAQLLAHLHTAAVAGLVPPAEVGRPRGPGEACRELTELPPAPQGVALSERLAALHEVVGAVAGGGVPVLVAAAVVHAELVACRPFTTGNAVVARALERVLLRVGGVDPTGVAVPELGHTDRAGTDYRGALAAYVDGGPDGVRLWLLHCADAVERAAAAGTRIADAVLVGRLPERS